MMFFQDAQFPACADIIRSRIVGGKLPSRVLSALRQCIDSERFFTTALSAGTYPRVDIVKLRGAGPMGARGTGGNYNPCTDENINKVFINLWVAQDVEHFDGADTFERYLLHEVVHWGRFVAKKPGTIRVDGVDREAGNLFEERAYGGHLGDHDDVPCP